KAPQGEDKKHRQDNRMNTGSEIPVHPVILSKLFWSYFFSGETSSTSSSERIKTALPSPTDVLSMTMRTSTLSSAGGRPKEMVAVFHLPSVLGSWVEATALYPGVTCT